MLLKGSNLFFNSLSTWLIVYYSFRQVFFLDGLESFTNKSLMIFTVYSFSPGMCWGVQIVKVVWWWLNLMASGVFSGISQPVGPRFFPGQQKVALWANSKAEKWPDHTKGQCWRHPSTARPARAWAEPRPHCWQSRAALTKAPCWLRT